MEGLTGRVLGRSNNSGNVNGGVAYANANNASSNSNTNNGSRLANNQMVGNYPKKNRLYGKPSRDEGKQRARGLSLSKSTARWKAEKSR